MAGRVNLFGSALQIYQSMSRTETRLAGSSFNRRLGKTSFLVIGITLKRKNGT